MIGLSLAILLLVLSWSESTPPMVSTLDLVDYVSEGNTTFTISFKDVQPTIQYNDVILILFTDVEVAFPLGNATVNNPSQLYLYDDGEVGVIDYGDNILINKSIIDPPLTPTSIISIEVITLDTRFNYMLSGKMNMS